MMEDDRWMPSILEERDLATVEYLTEGKLDRAVKDYLLRVFGKDGERDKMFQYQEQKYEKCLRYYKRCVGCGSCGCGHPYFQVCLLTLIVNTLKDIKSGHLDPVTGECSEDGDFCF